MPDSGTAEPATVLAWHVRPGELVNEGDPICTVDLGNAQAVVSSPAPGRVREAYAGIRARVAPGSRLAVVDALLPAQRAAPPPAAPRLARGREPSAQPVPGPVPETTLREFHSPAVRRLAAELGVDLANVRGTGREGRVTREDVLAAEHSLAPGKKPG